MGEHHREEHYRDIIEGCKKGNRNAQKRFYEMFASKLYAIAVRYVKDEDEAKDVFHDGVLKILDKIGKYNYTGSFEGWVRQVFVNFVIDYLKKKKTVSYNEEISEQNYNEYIDDSFYTLEESELSSLKAEELMKFISELSPAYRIVFNLYVLEGYSHKEIAKYLGISENTSKSNYSRARKKLRDKIEKYLKKRNKRL